MHPKLLSTFSEYSNIILVGWGTGWHIQPILNIVEELREKKLLWIGGRDSSEEKEAKKAGITFESVPTLKLSTTRSPRVLLYPLVLIDGILKARKILCSVIANEVKQSRKKIETAGSLCPHGWKKNSLCIFSKGWPGSVAIGIAAWSLGIPLYIHESDTIPGRSNRILGKIAETIFLGFESAKKYFNWKKCEIIWQILHPVFEWKVRSKEWRVWWKTEKKHILVICGSQGSRAVFEAIVEQFGKDNPYEWIIALGKLNVDMKSDFQTMGNMQALDWISQEDIAHLLENTDLAITRGSATTLAEIDVFGVKKIIIPLPYSADNHQYYNAREYEKRWDILLEQRDIKNLSNSINSL